MNFVRFNAPSHPALNALASEINSEAEIAKVPPCLLAAIVNRETGGRNVYQEGMPHAPGCGVGLTQITSGVDWSNPDDPTFAGYHLMRPGDNLYVAAAYFLLPLITSATRLQRDNPESFARYGNGQIAYYVAAGYNSGWGTVMSAFNSGVDPDDRTTDHYAADVLSNYEVFVAESART